MKSDIPPFKGFHKEVFSFLSDLAKNNNFDWFNKNRERYQNQLVQPARSFVVEMGEFFSRLNPAIRTEPKFNETLMRINKDMRFSKGEPYRDYFLIHFGKFKMDTEFYVYFDSNSFAYGLFINNNDNENDFFFKRNIEKYRKEFLKILDQYKIDNRYELHSLGKNSKMIKKKFDGKKHLDILLDIKMSLLQKSLTLNNRMIYSVDFVIEAIKTFTKLYPVYCFSVSPQPMKLIEEFEDHFGYID